MQILKFTLLRLALAVAFFLGFHYLGMGILLAIAAGILCSAMVSFIFFPGQGNAAAEQLRTIVEGRPKRRRIDEIQEEVETSDLDDAVDPATPNAQADDRGGVEPGEDHR
ncbi:MAG: DUF4229 domain-containing protein [Flaviflexus sp.]|nr:DUF4229 domain-containing protein [Flaviflexus sp.]